MKLQKAIFGGGCFWGIEAAFREFRGVVDTAAGYMGGRLENPSYEDVCTDATGHAEVVMVTFDPSVVSYEQLLDLFWKIHDPTTLNRQGPDIGTQYRSVIFYLDSSQEAAAGKSLNELQNSGQFDGSIITAIEKAADFWRAEDYHQYDNRPRHSSCRY